MGLMPLINDITLMLQGQLWPGYIVDLAVMIFAFCGTLSFTFSAVVAPSSTIETLPETFATSTKPSSSNLPGPPGAPAIH